MSTNNFYPSKALSNKLFFNKESGISHLAYEKELAFYNAVKSGDINKVKTLMLPLDNKSLGILSDNPIRNLKYHLIITISLITRFCMEAGMPSETAYTLSDIYIQKLDKLNKETDITELHKQVIFDYTNRMKAISQENIFSMPVIKAIDYIEDHINEKFSLDKLSQHLNLNKTYMCKLFKAETNLTIGNYTKKLKIEFAKNMLVYSDYSPSAIANNLSFSSHSHFINVFKKETGTTPHEYRNTHYKKHFDNMYIKD